MEPPFCSARTSSVRASSNRTAHRYVIGVVFRNRRNPICNALALTPATPAKSSRSMASRAFSSMKCSARRTKNGAIDVAAASNARCLLCGIETSKVDTSAEAMALPELTPAGERELHEIEVSARWGVDPDARPILHRIHCNRTQLGFTVSEIQLAFLGQIGDAMGTPERIVSARKRVEAVGFDEVILYFNVGLKPHAQVKQEIARFVAEVAPIFDGRR
jgi:hypothetical protein